MQKKPASMAEKLSEEIIDYIVQSGLKPGDRLPSEYEISEIFHAGRSTVREAVRALSSRNIVEVRHGAGTFLSPKRGVADDPLGFTFVQNKLRLAHDLLEIRFLIEPQIAALAAVHATEQDIRSLDRLCAETESLIRRKKDHTQKDTELHTCIAQSSKNVVVPNLIPIINSAIEVFIDVTNSSLMEETIASHREIVDAVRSHDPLRARDAMYLHLVYNRRQIGRLEQAESAGTTQV